MSALIESTRERFAARTEGGIRCHVNVEAAAGRVDFPVAVEMLRFRWASFKARHRRPSILRWVVPELRRYWDELVEALERAMAQGAYLVDVKKAPNNSRYFVQYADTVVASDIPRELARHVLRSSAAFLINFDAHDHTVWVSAGHNMTGVRERKKWRMAIPKFRFLSAFERLRRSL